MKRTIHMNAFHGRTDVQALLNEVFELYAASKSPEATNALNKLRLACAETVQLKAQQTETVRQLSERSTECSVLQQQARALTKTNIELKMVAATNEALQPQLDKLRSERGTLEQTIRAKVQRENEAIVQQQREQHIRQQDRLEQTNERLQSEVDKMRLMSANSSRKGADMEHSIRAILLETLGVEVADMSKTAHSMDIRVTIADDLDVFIDTKNVTGALPAKEIAKFENDKNQLLSTTSTAHGFILMTRNQISRTVPSTLIASNLYRYRGSPTTYIVTGNSTTALFQALILVAKAYVATHPDACSDESDACGNDVIPEFNNIIRRMIPLFKNHGALVQQLEKMLKQHKKTHSVDSAALAAQLDLSGLDGIEDVNLMKALGSKRRRL